MGGRGSSSGGGGGGGGGSVSLNRLLAQFNKDNKGASNTGTNQYGSTLNLAPYQKNGDYDGNGNPNLIKWQGQTDDKSASFLAKVDKTTNLNQIQQQTNDPYSFHNLPFQRFVSNVGLNAQTQVLSESDFRKYVKQTGATVIYRGWSGQNSVDRFKNSPNSHVGNGINGDGYYWSSSKGTARSYGYVGSKGALSPSARVVSLSDVNKAISKSSTKLQSSLRKAGSLGQRTYGPNDGQAQMALKMGYNVIDAGWAVIPLTRDAVVVSAKNAF